MNLCKECGEKEHPNDFQKGFCSGMMLGVQRGLKIGSQKLYKYAERQDERRKSNARPSSETNQRK